MLDIPQHFKLALLFHYCYELSNLDYDLHILLHFVYIYVYIYISTQYWNT